MAIQSRIHCRKCLADKWLTHSVNEYPSICDDCKKLEEDKEHADYMAALDKLTLEERLREVEEWIYRYDRTDHTPFPFRKIG